MNNFFKQILRPFLYLLLFFYYIFEEIVWNSIARPIYRYIQYLKPFEIFEKFLKRQNRYILLIFFLLPFVIGELMGLLSPVLLINGHPIMAVLLYAFKLLVVSVAFWIFKNHKDRLLSFKIIKFLHSKLIDVTEKIKNTGIYKEMVHRLKEIKKFVGAKIISLKLYINKFFK